MLQIFDYTGNYRRGVGKDCDQTWYSFTRDRKEGEKYKTIPKDHPFLKYLDSIDDGQMDTHILYQYTLTFNSKDKPECNIIDEVEIVHNGKKIKTTLGRYIFNKIVFYSVYNNKHFKFVDRIMFVDTYQEVVKDIRQMIIEGHAKEEDLIAIVNMSTEFGLRLSTLYNAGLTVSMMLPDAKFEEFRRKELDKVKEEVIRTGDITIMQDAENRIIEFAKKYYKDDDMMEMFASKVKVSFTNEFKNLNISMGALPSITGGKPVVVFDSLADGVKPEYLADLTNTGMLGAVSRGLKTATAGVLYKDVENSLEGVFGKKGDCGSTEGREVNTTDRFELLNRHIIVGGKSILVTSENVDKYLGKTVKMRVPSKCKMKDGHFCSHCLGELPFKLTGRDEIPIGMYTSDTSSAILNMYMKATHSLGADMFVVEDLNKFLTPSPKKPLFETKEDPISKITRVYCLEDIEWRVPVSSVDTVDTYYMVLAHGSIVKAIGDEEHAMVLGTEIMTKPTEVINPDIEKAHELERHVIFRYNKGDVFMMYNKTLRKEDTVYKMFNLFISGNASSLVPFETHMVTMKNALKSNKKAKISDMSLEIILNCLARDAKDVTKPARETGTKDYKFVSMYDLVVLSGTFAGVTNADAVKSLMSNLGKPAAEQSKKISPLEKAIRY